MPAIKTDHFDGGKNITGKDGKGEDLAADLRAAVDDIAELRAQYIALLQKLDTDFAAQNAAVASSQLDVDYESTLTPAAQTLTKA